MIIDKEKCIGCEECHPYCPVEAIATAEWEGKTVSVIDQDRCVECGCCYKRSSCCPVDAIEMPALQWPRAIREHFSNPDVKHPLTSGKGRGTEEMKTNDVTGRYRRGETGVAMEMGRPGVGTSIRDLEKVCMALAAYGVEFEELNPVAALMADIKSGKFKEDVLGERVLSAIIEFKVERSRLSGVLAKIREIAGQIDTVFSLDLISRLEDDGVIPTTDIAREAGYSPLPNTKTNIGLGRPLFEEA